MLGRKNSHGSSSWVLIVYMFVTGDNKKWISRIFWDCHTDRCHTMLQEASMILSTIRTLRSDSLLDGYAPWYHHNIIRCYRYYGITVYVCTLNSPLHVWLLFATKRFYCLSFVCRWPNKELCRRKLRGFAEGPGAFQRVGCIPRPVNPKTLNC